MADMNVRQLFETALALSEPERARFLATHCRRDPKRRARVERLLRAHAEAADFLALPAVDRPEAEISGQIGPFELIGRIGEGGFATVYLARQRAPIARDVALKVLKHPVDSAQWLARFEAERRVLALMDHPGIARVLDAGTIADGRPYCAMELVRGQCITDYCDAGQLDLRGRLELFVNVCRAVQHAHLKGVIHRDLKPANILITLQDGKPTPKVIDFGIAKAVRGQAAASALPALTERWQMVGTPQYLSPEQAEGSPGVDTRTDVYSLGAVLYELLTGTTPFEPGRLRDASWTELIRILREEDPARPSARLREEVSWTERLPATRSVLNALRGDLDWVVLKCLAREPAGRYETVADLVTDLTRFLDGQPVAAAPPSTWYRTRKLLRRHRRHVVAAAMLAASLLGGTIGALWFAWRSVQREEETSRIASVLSEMLEHLDAEKAGAALRQDIYLQVADDVSPTANGGGAGVADPWQTACFTSAAVHSVHDTVFVPVLRAIDMQLADRPDLQANLLRRVGNAMTRLGLFDQAAASHARAIELLEPRRRADDLELLAAHHALGDALARDIQAEAAEPHASAAYRGRLQRLGPDDRDTLTSAESLGRVYWRLHRLDEADALLSDTLRRRRLLADGGDDTIWSLWRLAQVRGQQGRLYDAETLLLEAQATLGPTRADEAIALGVEATLANVRVQLGWFAEAERTLESTLGRSRQVRADDHRDTMFLRCVLLSLRLRRHHAQQAVAEGIALAKQRRRVLGADHRDTVSSDLTLAEARCEEQQFDIAESELRDVLGRSRSLYGVAFPVTQQVTRSLVNLLDARSRQVEAHELRHRCVVEALDCESSAEHDNPGFSRWFFAMLLALGDSGLERRYLARVRTHYDVAPAVRCATLTRFAEALLAASRSSEAEAIAREAIECIPAGPGEHPLELMNALHARASALAAMGNYDEALVVHETVKRLRTAWLAATGERLPGLAIGHAQCLLDLGRHAEAEGVLLDSHEALAAEDCSMRRPPIAAVRVLIDVYSSWPDESDDGPHHRAAARWRQRIEHAQ